MHETRIAKPIALHLLWILYLLFHSHEITNCHVIWAIKDESISSTFFDVGAGQFLLPKLFSPDTKKSDNNAISKRMKFTLDGRTWHYFLLVTISKITAYRQYTIILIIDDKTGELCSDSTKNNFGSALGPDWSRNLKISGGLTEQQVLLVYHDGHQFYKWFIFNLEISSFEAKNRPSCPNRI